MRITWGADAERRLRVIPARDAAAVRAAVLRFAAERDGWIWEPAEGSLRRRLRIGRYRILMVLTPDSQHMSVVRLYRADR
jgi:hypothetical protein